MSFELVRKTVDLLSKQLDYYPTREATAEQ